VLAREGKQRPVAGRVVGELGAGDRAPERVHAGQGEGGLVRVDAEDHRSVLCVRAGRPARRHPSRDGLLSSDAAPAGQTPRPGTHPKPRPAGRAQLRRAAGRGAQSSPAPDPARQPGEPGGGTHRAATAASPGATVLSHPPDGVGRSPRSHGAPAGPICVEPPRRAAGGRPG
jgi:hypothetical protein